MTEIQSEELHINNIFEEKTQIGWNLVQLGILSKKWKEQHERYQTQKRTTAKSNLGTSWGNKVQSILWDYTFGAWNHRNKTLKGQDVAEQRTILAKETSRKVRNTFHHPPDVGHADRLLFHNLE